MEPHPMRESTVLKAISMFLAVVFLLTGSVKIAGVEMMIESFRNWGYSATFMYVVGVLEIAGAVMLLLPRFRLYGAILISLLMVGATFTHVRAGEWIMAPGPILMLVLAVTIAWAERAVSGPRERHA